MYEKPSSAASADFSAASYAVSSVGAIIVGSFSLLLALTIVGLFATFYIQENSRHHTRSETISLLQQQVEQLLSLVSSDSFADSNFTIYDADDPFKEFCFNAAAISTGTKKRYTAPNETGTLALLSDFPSTVAPPNAEYFTLTPDSGLSAERVLVFNPTTFGTTDLGPGAGFEVDLTDTGIVPDTYTRAEFSIDSKGRVLTAQSNEAGNVTCPTFFNDNIFAVLHFGNPTKILQFDVSAIPSFVTQVMTVQDASGTIAYLSDVESGVFLDTIFRVQNAVMTNKQVALNAGSVSDFATTIMTIQDASGTVAYLSDIPQTFADNVFAIIHDGGTNQRAEFEATNIGAGTTRSFAMPDLDGVLGLTAAAQSLTDKTIQGSSNLVEASDLLTTGSPVTLLNSASASNEQTLIANSSMEAIWGDVGGMAGTWLIHGNGVFAGYHRINDRVRTTFRIDGISSDTNGNAVIVVPFPWSGAGGNFLEGMVAFVVNGTNVANPGMGLLGLSNVAVILQWSTQTPGTVVGDLFGVLDYVII